jgi:hypothetical protein
LNLSKQASKQQATLFFNESRSRREKSSKRAEKMGRAASVGISTTKIMRRKIVNTIFCNLDALGVTVWDFYVS